MAVRAVRNDHSGPEPRRVAGPGPADLIDLWFGVLDALNLAALAAVLRDGNADRPSPGAADQCDGEVSFPPQAREQGSARGRSLPDRAA